MAPNAATPVKPAIKIGKFVIKPKSEGKKKRKSRKESYSSYIYRMLKQVHPDTGISTRGMSVMNSLINDLFDKIAPEAGKLVRYNKKSALTSREIQTAVRLLLPESWPSTPYLKAPRPSPSTRRPSELLQLQSF